MRWRTLIICISLLIILLPTAIGQVDLGVEIGDEFTFSVIKYNYVNDIDGDINNLTSIIFPEFEKIYSETSEEGPVNPEDFLSGGDTRLC